MDATDHEATRREFLGLTALVTAGVVAGGAFQPAGATAPKGKVTRNELGLGRLAEPISVSTNGPSDFHIHQVILEPGADSGWHTHPGTALDIVKTGTVTAYFEGVDCEPVTVEAGQAFFVPAGVAHFAANEGSVAAEIYVTYLVAAGAAPRADAAPPANCPS